MTEVDEFSHPLLVASYDTLNSYPPGTQPDFYRGIARSIGHRVRSVELGCGTGIVACSLSADGHEVIGVDPSKEMLSRAQAKGCDVEWRLGGHDVIARPEADIAIMSGHVAQFFVDDDDWIETLSSLRACLVIGGTLTFESRNPDAEEWRRWGRRKLSSVDPRLGQIEHWSESHGMADGILTYTNHYDFTELDTKLAASSTLRFRSFEELSGSLAECGFETEDVYGDWEKGPLSPQSPEMVFVATRRS